MTLKVIFNEEISMGNFRAFFRVIGAATLSLLLAPTLAMATNVFEYFSCVIGPNCYASEGFHFAFDLGTCNIVLRNFTEGKQGNDFLVLAGELEGGALFFNMEFILKTTSKCTKSILLTYGNEFDHCGRII